MFQARDFERNPYWGAMSRNRQFACLNGPRIVQNVVRNLPAKSLKTDFLWHQSCPNVRPPILGWPSSRDCIFFDQFWMTSTKLWRDLAADFCTPNPSLEPNSVSKLPMKDFQWKTPNGRLPMKDSHSIGEMFKTAFLGSPERGSSKISTETLASTKLWRDVAGEFASSLNNF